MTRLTLSLCLIASISYSLLPINPGQELAQAQTYDEEVYAQLEAEYTSELTAFASTHTDAEVTQYAQAHLNELTTEALVEGEIIEQETLAFEEYWATIFLEISDGSGTYDPRSDYTYCVRTRLEECRRNYNADLFASAATASAIMAGCVGLTAGSGLILCAAAALAVHAAGIAAARERYEGCRTRAISDCKLSYWRQ